MNGLFVIKRSGDRVPVRFDAITRRLSVLATGTSEVRHALNKVDCAFVTGKIASSLTPGVTTSDIDRLAAETCAYMSRYDPEYMILAGRIAVSNLHKQRGIHRKKWTENVQEMMNVPDCNPLLSQGVYEFVMANADALNAAINYENDYRYDYFAIKTLERGYLVQLGGKDGPRETPQEMLMRVCCGKYALDMERYLKGHRGLDAGNLERALSSYRHMSNMMYTNATPTLFNCGGPNGGTPSCYLLTMENDSIDGIYSTLAKTAKLSKACGGIGISVTNIRAFGTPIRGTNGVSTGLIPMLRVFNDTARYVDQGGGKRKGAFAIYCEPWHSDIEDLIDLKRNDGKEEARARDMFYGLWIPDLFMRRVEEDREWSLFCPTKVTKRDEKTGKILHLYDVWGEEFEKMYVDAEKAGLANKTIKARDLWYRIVDNEILTGVPYMMYKDSCNRKSNQSNLGTIRGSNLCTEIVQYTSSDEVAVCTLSSLSLPAFCNRENGGFFDHDSFFLVVYDLVIELNNILFTNRHVIRETEFSCENQMSIGLGVQGLADVFAILRMPFESQRAKKLNREIFETLYFAALSSSCDLAKRTGKKYGYFEGSPASLGILQYDMWNEKPSFPKWDWEDLKSRIKK
jgi:ribonucleoside-diphosphate reductase alpha chain